MTEWVYDSKKQGLATVFFDYEIEALKLLWCKKGEHLSSREVWQQVNDQQSISRASIINSLNRMAKAGILDYKETTGKGGHRGLYAAKFSESELKAQIAEALVKSIRENLS